MLTVLFWNVNGRDRGARCASLVRLHAPTLLILAECPDAGAVLGALNASPSATPYQSLPVSSACRLKLFSTIPLSQWVLVAERTRYTIHQLDRPGAERLLVVCVHLRGKLATQDREQDASLRKLAARIAECESREGHARTLLVGDLNADPFQEGVYAADGLHAVMTRHEAERGSRVVEEVAYRFFYNPMWRFFGETPAGPPGTYFWDGSGRNAVFFWSMLDQCLIRPELLPYFPPDGVRILTQDGTISFRKSNGRPNPEVASDHFPILVRLDYPGV